MAAMHDSLDITHHTLIDAIDKAANSSAGVTFIHKGDQEEYISYSELRNQSIDALGYLQQLGLKKGSKVILYVEDNKTFLITYWACLFGGIIPAPLAVGSQDDHKKKVLSAFDVLDHAFIITDERNKERILDFDKEGLLEEEDVFVTISELLSFKSPGVILRPVSSNLAYIQFSSGSTGAPKGVELTHSNLVHNTLDIANRSEVDSNDRALSWMPLTHDMGLICFHLTALVRGIQQYLIPTSLFIRRPLLWIEKANWHQVTLLYSPNFGYRYFLDALADSTPDWDLSQIRLIYNGAEPISHQLCLDFTDRLGEFGMKSNVMYPGYGMAEASVAVSLPKPGALMRRHDLDRTNLNVGDAIVPVTGQSEDIVSFVENGFPIDHCQVRIADNDDQELLPGHVGNIQISGGNVTARYHQNPTATKLLKTADGWVRTGDIGFMLDGYVTITGRQKNLIILNGINYYPQDIERAAMLDDPALIGRIVAASVPGDTGESLILFVHGREKKEVFHEQIETLKRRVFERIGIVVDEVIQTKRIPKTTSGKIQVFKLRQMFLDGAFDDQRELNKEHDEDVMEITPENLQQVWMDLFGQWPEVDEDLRMLGLKSMGAYRFSHTVQKRFGKELTVAQIYRHNSLNAICDALKVQEEVITPQVEVIDQKSNEALSSNQKYFLHLSQTQPRQGLDKIIMKIAFDGKVDRSKLQEAFHQVIKDFDALRITYELNDGSISQRLLNPSEVTFPWNEIALPEDISPDQFVEETGVKLYAREYKFNGELPFDIHFFTSDESEKSYLLFACHHSVSDGWSMGLLFNRLLEYYTSEDKDAGSHTFSSYFNYGRLETHWLQTQQASNQRNYWSQRLEGIPALDIQNLGLQNLAESDPTEAVKTFSIDSRQWKLLNQFVEKEGITLFSTMAALLNILLYKYTGQKDFGVGTTIAARETAKDQQVFGSLINTIVLRTPIDSGISLREYLQEVSRTVSEGLENGHYPIGELISDLHGVRSESSTLFQVLLIYQNFLYHQEWKDFGKDLSSKITPVNVNNTSVPVTFEFIENTNHADLLIKHNQELFTPNDLDRLFDRISLLIEKLIDKPTDTIKAISLFNSEADGQIMALSHGENNQPFDHFTTVELFESTVDLHGSRVAIVHENQVFTYDKVNAMANKLGRYLINNFELDRGNKIGLIAGRNHWSIISMIAGWKAGLTIIPIDESFPISRKTEILEANGVEVVIATKDDPAFNSTDFEVILLEGNAPRIQGRKSQNLLLEVAPNDLAYILYTSGSTGKPKGVEIEHFSLLDYITTFKKYFGFTDSDVVLQQSSVSFDTIFEEVFPALTSGASIVITPNGGADVGLIASLSKQHLITIISTTPLVIGELNGLSTHLPALRALISGGDILRKHQVDRLLGQLSVYNTYGPTETTVCATFGEVTNLEEVEAIGRPIDNHKVLILDSDQQLSPIGVPGEIYIGGPGLARGYFDRPEDTEDRFVLDPTDSDQRLFKTGDLGFWTETGTIQFVGRRDRQIKWNGYRIEIGEIEQAILKHDHVTNAVVFEADTQRNKALFAAYVGQVEEQELFGHIHRLLPFYMIPARLFQLEGIVTTVTGKPDLRKLQEMVTEKAALPARTKTPLERQIEGAWKEVLSMCEVDVDDNFFEIGGNSIQAVKIASRLKRALKKEITLQHIISNQTIASLAAMIKSLPEKEEAPILRVDVQPQYPVSSAQRRMWLLGKLEDDSSSYHISMAFEVTGALDRYAWDTVVSGIVDKYEILRTHFIEIKGEPYQVISEIPDQITQWHDFTKRRCQNGDKMDILISNQQPFDISEGPLFRIDIIQLEEQQALIYFTFHHLITDAWSLEQLMAEIALSYNGNSIQEPLALQYKDYSKWANERNKQFRSEHQDFWKTHLSGDLPTLNFKEDFARPLSQSFNGQKYRKFFSEDTSERLTSFAKSHQVSVFQVLAAGCYAIFARLTGQRDIILGVPHHGRNHEMLETQLGLFVNTLPLRIEINTEEDFNALVSKVASDFQSTNAHRDYPLDAIVEDLDLPRDLARNPIFDVIVDYRDRRKTDALAHTFNDLTFNSIELEHFSSQFDLAFDFIGSEQGLELELTYNTDLYRSERIKQLISILENVLDDATSTPEKSIDDLVLLPKGIAALEADRREKLQISTDQLVPVIHHFESSVAANPHRLALELNNTAWTYQEINRLTNQVARWMQNQNLVKGDTIAIQVDQTEWMVILPLAAMKLGVTFLPLDPHVPEERIVNIFKQAAPRLLFTSYETQKRDVTIIPVDQLHALIENIEVSNLKIDQDLTQLAYVLFTSGSTGTPKGVKVTQENLASFRNSIVAAYELESNTPRLLQLASMGFDVFVGDLMRALTTSGTMIICTEEVKLDPQKLLEKIQASCINILEATPGLLQPLLQLNDLRSCLSAIRLLILGSDFCSNDLFNQFLAVVSDQARVINSYGTTETTIDSCYFEASAHTRLKGSVPVGLPLSNSLFIIADENGNEMPQGYAGELLIGGPAVAEGYLGLEKQTAERFIDLDRYPNIRFYRTGDLAWKRWDGQFEVLGRMDAQVKLRGYRIELEEIEAQFVSHPMVSQATVTILEELESPELIAFVVAHEVDESQLRSHLIERLPAYMVPPYIQCCEALPLTTNGKVDHKALLKNFDPKSIRKVELVLPETKLEKALCEVTKDLLKKPAVGVNQSFFELGGNSMKAVQLMQQLDEKHGYSINLRQIFLQPNLGELAKELTASLTTAQGAGQIFEDQDHYPLSSNQLRLWALDQKGGQRVAYHMMAVYHVDGPLDVEKLNMALTQLINSHEILRTSFRSVAGNPRQVVGKKLNSILKQLHSGQSTVQQIDSFKSQILKQPFDLRKEPLLRCGVVTYSETRHELVICIHHILSDGWSVNIMLDQLMKRYLGKNLNLSKVAQYKDFAIENKINMGSGSISPSQRFWMNQLTGIPSRPELPTDYSRTAVLVQRNDMYRHEFTNKESALLEESAHTLDSTSFGMIMVAVNLLLYRYTGQSDQVIGTVSSGRRSGFSESIGFFANTLPIRLQLNPKEHLSEAINKAKQLLADVFSYEDYPFERMIEDLGSLTQPGRHPLFDVMVSLQDASFDEGSMHLGDNIKIEGAPLINPDAKFDLLFNFIEKENGLSAVEIEYNAELFSRSSVRRMYQQLFEIMSQMRLSATQPLEVINYLPNGEDSLLRHFSQGSIDNTVDQFDHVLEPFQTQVMRNPDRIAITSKDGYLTYRKLNDLSSSLASRLINEFGLKHGEKVGIVLPKDEWVVVAIYGVLKAGGCYVPVDINHPEKRKKHILSEADCTAVIAKDTTIGHYFPPEKTLKVDDIPSFGVAELLPQQNSSEDLAYVLFTSGTTGKPKGAMITHDNVLDLLIWLGKMVYEGAKDQVMHGLLTASTTFDASVQQLFAPLAYGATLTLASEEEKSEPLSYLKRLEYNLIDTLDATPSFLSVVIQESEAIKKKVPLKYAIVGGEILSEELIEKYCEWAPNSQLINVYGVTEASVDSTYELVKPKDISRVIGRPKTNTKILILNTEKQTVPIGVWGELCIGGRGLSLGYLNNEELTRERFVVLPQFDNERFYLTGDIARWLPDGRLQFKGRADDQVKLSGYRIELGEIEHQLHAHSHVSHATVLVRDEKLVAYYQGDTSIDELRAHLQKELPTYMVPKIWMEMTDWPLTTSGKTDKKALPDPIVSGATGNDLEGYTQRLVGSVWNSVLSVPQVSPESNFFELGGDSLLAMRVVARLHASGYEQIGVKDVFEFPVLLDFSDHIEQSQGGRKKTIVPIEEQSHYELSDSQRGIWFHEKLVDDPSLYQMSQTFEIDGPLSIDRLRFAIQQLINQNEVLRAQIVSHEGSPVAKTLPPGQIDTYFESHGSADESSMNAASEWCSVNIENGPLMKIALLRVSDSKYLLMWSIHHIIFDATSGYHLMSQLWKVYDEGLTEDALLGDKVQFKDCVAWLGKQKQSSKWDEHKKFWQKTLSDWSEPVQINPEAEVAQSVEGASLELGLSNELVKGLEQTGKTFNCSKYGLFLAAVAALTYRYTRKSDQLIGVPVEGRIVPEMEESIGLFVNTLPLRLLFEADNITLKDVAIAVKRTLLEAMDHQVYPMELMIQNLKNGFDRQGNALFSIIAGSNTPLQSQPMVTKDLKIIARPGESVKAIHDLSINLSNGGDAVKLVIDYNPSVHSEEFVQILGDRLLISLEEIATSIDSLIDNIQFETETHEETYSTTVASLFDF